MPVTRKQIGELLVDNGVITPEELEQAQAESDKTGESIAKVLARLGLAGENQLKNALELEFGVNFVSLTKYSIDFALLRLVPQEIVKEHLLVPISHEGNRLTVAMVDPSDAGALETLKSCLNGLQVKTVVCLEEDFMQFVPESHKPGLMLPVESRPSNGAGASESKAGPNGSGSHDPAVLKKEATDLAQDTERLKAVAERSGGDEVDSGYAGGYSNAAASTSIASGFGNRSSDSSSGGGAAVSIASGLGMPSSDSSSSSSAAASKSSTASSLAPSFGENSTATPGAIASGNSDIAEDSRSNAPDTEGEGFEAAEREIYAKSKSDLAKEAPSDSCPVGGESPALVREIAASNQPLRTESQSYALFSDTEAPSGEAVSPTAARAEISAQAVRCESAESAKNSKKSDSVWDTGSFPAVKDLRDKYETDGGDTGTFSVVNEQETQADAGKEKEAAASLPTQDQLEVELARRAQEEAIVLLANQILGGAIKRQCSNIHISPGDRQALVHYRLNGALYIDRRLPNTILEALIARYKMMARMSLSEQKIPQDGHIKVKSASKEIVCLLSTVPSDAGEHVVIWIV